MTLTNEIFATQASTITIFGLLIVVALLIILFFWVAFKTPVMTFLAGIWFKKPLNFIITRARRGKFVVSSDKDIGILNSRGMPYLETENSDVIEKKSGLSIFHSFGEFAFTLDKRYPYVVEELRKMNIPISSFEDYDNLVRSLENNDLKPEERKQLEDFKIEIRPYQTIKLHELVNMFPYNVTPALIESRTAHQIAKKQHLQNKFMNPQAAITIGIFIILASLGVGLAWRFLKSPGDCPACVCQAAEAVRTITNLTG